MALRVKKYIKKQDLLVFLALLAMIITFTSFTPVYAEDDITYDQPDTPMLEVSSSGPQESGSLNLATQEINSKIDNNETGVDNSNQLDSKSNLKDENGENSNQFLLVKEDIKAATAQRNTKHIPTLINLGIWNEQNTKRSDFTMYTASIRYDKFHFRYDFFDRNNFKRVYFNVGYFTVVRGKDIKVIVDPGIAFNNKNNKYIGADVTVDVPKLGLNVVQRSYAGQLSDLHYTWVNLKVQKYATIQWYRLTRDGYTPDSYLGPKFLIKPFSVFYGFSTTRGKARAISVFGHFKF
jgi:hypothetical protein